MEPFRIVVTGWGIFVQMQARLSNSDRESFVESLKRARESTDPLECRGVLVDLREAHLDTDPVERVRAYADITRFLGAKRIAVAAGSASGAARIRDALDDAGLLDCSRIFVPGNVEGALTPALRWVEHGIEPTSPLLTP